MSGTDPWAIPELFEKLNERFPPTAVKKNPKGFDYIDIATTIERFNEVLGANWSVKIDSCEVTPINPSTDGVGVNRKSGAIPGYLAVVTGTLYALGSQRSGVGAHVEADPDMAVKTAYAEMIKKAGHEFGVGLYLWDEAERYQVEEGQRAAAGDVNALKAQVARLARKHAVSVTADALAEHFKVEKTDLNNAEVLKKILDDNGVVL